MTPDFAKKIMGRRLKKVVKVLKSAAHNGISNVEQIHQMRTEMRRAEAALQLFRDWMPTRRMESSRRQLYLIRRMAGKVRDFDVMKDCLASMAVHLSTEAICCIDHLIASSRKTSALKLRRACRRMIRRGFSLKVRSLWKKVQWRKAAAQPTPQEAIGVLIDRRFLEIHEAMDIEPFQAHELHAVRIACRQIRYTLELARKYFPAELFGSAISNLVRIQELIGNMNDQLTTLRLLKSMSAAEELARFKAMFDESVLAHEASLIEQTATILSEIRSQVALALSSSAELTKPSFAETSSV